MSVSAEIYEVECNIYKKQIQDNLQTRLIHLLDKEWRSEH